MKQRITYLVENAEDITAEQLSVQNESLKLNSLRAAKEHRLTFSLTELPQELYRVLRQCHELHIRWVSESQYTSIQPFVSRISPGLHTFFTPQKNITTNLLCHQVKKVFGSGLRCDTPQNTFIPLPILSERFSMSSASQYYSLLPSIQDLVTYIQQKVCPSLDSSCQKNAASLLSATYLDIDFDTISHALILNAFWAQGPEKGSWSEIISLGQREETIEVGVLTNEKAVDEEDLAFSGFLTVLGEDDKPKQTRFSFPSRHHSLPPSSDPLTYTTAFLLPTGLHPTMTLTLPFSSLEPPSETCTLHTHLTLPSVLFIDKYQFQDSLFLASKNLIALRSLSGATDLEAPDYVIPGWGSAALFEVAVPDDPSSRTQQDWTIEIPLHLRYLAPSSNTSGLVPAHVPWPVVFWACRAEEGAKMSVSPFDRVHLGYEALFGPKTMFYHVPPKSEGSLVETIQVPVLDLDRAGYVEWGTVVVVVGGFLWLMWKLFGGKETSKRDVEKKRK